MKRSRKTTLNLSQFEGRIAPSLSTTLTWQGDIDSLWGSGTSGTNTNWSSTPTPNKLPVDGNSLVFPAGTANKANNNDINALDLKALTISEGGYTIGGNPFTLSGGLTVSGTGAANSRILAPIRLVADQNFTNNAAFPLKTDQLDLGGHVVTFGGSGSFELGVSGGIVTGAGGITKTGAGLLRLFVGNDYTGPTLLNAGQIAITHPTSLGATGTGNGTTVAAGATLVFEASGTFGDDFTLNGAEAIRLQGQGGNSVSAAFSGALRLGSDAAIAATAASDSVLISGAVGGADDALAILTLNFAGTNQAVTFANIATFTTDLAGATPGAGGHDQLKVIGPVDLGGASLIVVPEFTPAIGVKFVIVDNDGTDPITGTFAGLIEGAVEV